MFKIDLFWGGRFLTFFDLKKMLKGVWSIDDPKQGGVVAQKVIDDVEFLTVSLECYKFMVKFIKSGIRSKSELVMAIKIIKSVKKLFPY